MTTPGQTDPMGSSVAGSADLQSSIDRLDQDMRGLTAAIQGMSNGNGTNTSPAMASSFAAQGVTFTNGGSGGATAYGAGLGNFGFNGSGGFFGTNPFSIGPLSGTLNPAQAAVNVGSSLINSQFKLGAQQLNDQAQINTYGYQQAGFWSVSAQSTIQQAFGGGAGHGLYQNNLALSATDARYGANLLSQISGQANYMAGAGPIYGRGNAPYQLAATTGMANPGLGMTDSAGISAAWYNPSTSYNLLMMGVGNTPLQLGTGRAQNMTGVEAAIGQRFGFQGFNGKTGAFNNQNLAANLNNPLFQMQIMEATGMTQQEYNVWAQQWTQMNEWSNASGRTMNQLQTAVSNYMNSTNGAAQQHALAQLKNIPGFNMSLLQSMTQAQAGMTATESSGNKSFVQGLEDATTAINKLTNVLSGGVVGQSYTSGYLGAAGSLNAAGVSGAGGTGATGTIVSGLLGTAISILNGGSSGSSGGAGGGNSGNPGGGSPAQNQALGKQMAAAYGWGSGKAWTDLNNVVMHESGWVTDAQNPSSSAFGIGQFLDQTWGEYDSITKAEARGNPRLQIKAMLDYIKGRYPGGPIQAWDGYFNRYGPGKNGYADGTTSAKPGVALVGERGPELVHLSGGQQIINAAQTAKMMQPVFSGGGGGGGGLSIVFQSGAITISNSGGNATSGYHTSADVQPTAAQLVQAVETALAKSSVIRNIAAGVTG